MNILLCCEFYYPSVGGVQFVMQQLAERFAAKGHTVTVATTRLPNRIGTNLNGVTIKEFSVSGNYASGVNGDVQAYHEFLKSGVFDVILIKAAQQWTFDALWPVLDQIHARKVFIPCGFSGFYEPSYAEYFHELPDILRRFDHLIFYAEHYRDVDFARTHGLQRYSIIPNGACEVEFSVPVDTAFRQRQGIPEDSFIFLTVGSLTGSKGHLEIAEAFTRLDTCGRAATLILNGNVPIATLVHCRSTHRSGAPLKVRYYWDEACKLAESASRALGVFNREGWLGVQKRIINIVYRLAGHNRFIARLLPLKIVDPFAYWIKAANDQAPIKQVLQTDFPRPELIQAFKTADLFVFASNIEYSPLVLYEAVAAGTPFLTVPVGNAEEIARWTAAGIICPATVDERGWTRVSPAILANEMSKAMASPELLAELGRTGHERWLQNFTWARIVDRYEAILVGAASPGDVFLDTTKSTMTIGNNPENSTML